MAGRHVKPDRPPLHIGDSVQFGVRPTFGSPDLASAPPLFALRARRRAVCLAIGHVDHGRLVFGAFGSEADHNPGEDAIVAPALPTVVEGSGPAVSLRRAIPAQPIAIDEDCATEGATIIDAGLAMALGE